MAHPVEKKLRSQILPYLVMAEKLDEWKLIWIYTVYRYCGEFFLLVGGIGLSNPIINYLTGSSGVATDSASGTQSTIIGYLSGNPYAWIFIFLILAWGLVKFYVNQNDLEKKYTLAKSCQLQCRKCDKDMHDVLSQKNPIPDLDSIRTRISAVIDRNIIEDAWPFHSDDPSITKRVDEIAVQLVKKFQGEWEIVSGDERSGGN
jgi:hypothetical protein